MAVPNDQDYLVEYKMFRLELVKISVSTMILSFDGLADMNLSKQERRDPNFKNQSD
jgi:hypothetical protein